MVESRYGFLCGWLAGDLLDAGPDSVVQPLFNALIEPVLPYNTVTNTPASLPAPLPTPEPATFLYSRREPTPNAVQDETP